MVSMSDHGLTAKANNMSIYKVNMCGKIPKIKT